MTQRTIGLCAASIGLCWILAPAPAMAETKKRDAENKGMTLEDVGRGLKSAAKNVENEIPKIGPAIGDTFNKITGKDSDKTSSQESHKAKK